MFFLMFKAIFFRGVQYNIFKQLREISVSIKKKEFYAISRNFKE